jgi:hypothetical protein
MQLLADMMIPELWNLYSCSYGSQTAPLERARSPRQFSRM